MRGTETSYGWWIVTATVFCISFSPVPLVFLTLGVFMVPLSAEFGWSRGEISFALTITALVFAVVTPVVGRFVDAFGAKRTLLYSLVLYALAVASLRYISDSIWFMYGQFALIGVVGAGASALPYVRIISAWFDKGRGLAMGFAMAGIGLGAAIMPVLAEALIEAVGWRHTYLFLGILVSLSFVAAGLILKDSPDNAGQSSNESNKVSVINGNGPGSSANSRVYLQRLEFWLLVITSFSAAVSLTGAEIHFFPLMVDRGIDAPSAAMIVGLSGVVTIFSRIIVGWLLDRYFAPLVGTYVFSAALIGILILIFGGTSFWPLVVVAILFGLGTGAESDLFAYLVSRYFDLRKFGEIFGIVNGAFMVGAAVGPVLVGVGYDVDGHYRSILWVNVAMLAVVVFALSRMRPFPAPAAKDN